MYLVGLDYVAFKQIAPGTDVGFDLVREHERTQQQHGAVRSQKRLPHNSGRVEFAGYAAQTCGGSEGRE